MDIAAWAARILTNSKRLGVTESLFSNSNGIRYALLNGRIKPAVNAVFKSVATSKADLSLTIDRTSRVNLSP